MIAAPTSTARLLRFYPALLLGFLALVLPLAAAPQFVHEAELVERVIALLDRRLAVMPEVAAIKYEQQKPIADPAREREVLEQSVTDARTLQLDAEAARAFFAVQIAMARSVQEHLHAQWRASGATPPSARDLVKEIRPELDALGRELLPAVYLASPWLADTATDKLQGQLARLRRHEGTTEAQLTELAGALHALRLVATPTWATVQRVGVLRVGTTGDYAPFSDDRGEGLRGLDVELAQALAKSWGLSLLFVRTTWPTLMEDLAKRRYDLAASGISITAERRRVAAFSMAYHFDGKTPIARRENAERFSSLEKIDQPGVRVIVNPGGTNERFARENIKRATILLHPDNRTIFEEIVARRADLMITDSTEVKVRERVHPELQGTMTEPFTRAGKAILLPADTELTARIDAWLAEQIDSGEIAKRLAEALSAHDR